MVDRLLIERILSDIRSNTQDLRQATDITWEVYKVDKRVRRFVERTLHILIEACIDIAQHIISDEKFREPDSYRDTVVTPFAVLIARCPKPLQVYSPNMFEFSSTGISRLF